MLLILICQLLAFSSAQGDSLKLSNSTLSIVGGQAAKIGEFPFFAFPADGRGMVCGAALIHPDILITASHCNGRFFNFGSPRLVGFGRASVYIGATLIDGSDAVDTIAVGLIRRHPKYNRKTQEHDIALVKLKEPSRSPVVKWNTNPNLPKIPQSVTTIGVGNTQEGGDLSGELLKVNVRTLDYETCLASYGSRLYPESMICASASGKDSCQGDSGGPLLTSDRKTLLGKWTFALQAIE
jgi:trypsin